MTDQIPTRIPSHISYDLPGAQDGDGSEDNCFEMPEALEEVDQVFSKPAEAPYLQIQVKEFDLGLCGLLGCKI